VSLFPSARTEGVGDRKSLQFKMSAGGQPRLNARRSWVGADGDCRGAPGAGPGPDTHDDLIVRDDQAVSEG
jgi:hypothetical protein